MTNVRPWWFKGALLAGAGLAILLLVNSIANYIFISRRIVVEQLRRDMNKLIVGLDRQIRQIPPAERARLQPLLDRFSAENDHLLWLVLRDREGTLIARSGVDSTATFTEDYIRSRMRNREPIFKVRDTPHGEAVVEAFPLRLPPPASGSPPTPGTIEMAISIAGANAAFWPVLRNVIINCTAAVVLLAALIFMALQFPSYLKGKQLEQQLEIARSVQQDLLPSATKEYRHVDLAAECIPAWRVGGDFYDLFPTQPDRLAVILGDVSGKGLPAALLMGVIHGAVRSSDWARSPRQHEEASVRLNQLLCERTSGERFASMFWGYFDDETARLHYVNAGHCPPIVVRSEGSGVLALHEGGPVLGLLPKALYQQGFVQLGSGDLLVMYSDGVIEAADTKGEEFGQERLEAVVLRHARNSPDEIRAAVLAAIRQFTAGELFSDDLTLVIARIQGLGDAASQLKKQAAVPVAG